MVEITKTDTKLIKKKETIFYNKTFTDSSNVLTF